MNSLRPALQAGQSPSLLAEMLRMLRRWCLTNDAFMCIYPPWMALLLLQRSPVSPKGKRKMWNIALVPAAILSCCFEERFLIPTAETYVAGAPGFAKWHCAGLARLTGGLNESYSARGKENPSAGIP
jgi:hypothetical protein